MQLQTRLPLQYCRRWPLALRHAVPVCASLVCETQLAEEKK